MAAAELKRRGWHLTESIIADLCNVWKGNVDDIIKKTLDTDLKDIGTIWLNEDINSSQIDSVKVPCVLQLLNLRGISSPQNDDEPQETPYISLLTLTDGHIICSAVTLEPIRGLSVNTPPGSKILLSGTVEVQSNFLLLSKKNTSLLGGWVNALAEPWQLQKESKTLSNAVGDGGAPPPFVPFGQKIASHLLLSLKGDNFKSLHKIKERQLTEDEVNFQQMRKSALNEAHQVKIIKERMRYFGGENFVNDRNVSGIMETGLGYDGAVQRTLSGNAGHAFNTRGRPAYQNFGYRQLPESSHFYRYGPVGPSISNDLSQKFNKYAAIGRSDGSRLPFQGPHQSVSHYNHCQQDYQRMGGNNFIGQTQSMPAMEHEPRELESKAGETHGAGSFVNMPSAICSQNQISVKDNSQDPKGEKTQVPGRNKSDEPNNLQEQHQEKEQKSCDHKNILSQKGDNYNSPGRYVQNVQTKSCNSDNQSRSNYSDIDSYKTGPENHIADKRHYHNRGGYGSYRGPHRRHQQPFQRNHIVPAPGSQDYHQTYSSYGFQELHPPSYILVPFYGAPPFVPPQGFINDGGYQYDRRYSSRGRPTQQYYQPPQQRNH